MTEEIRLWVEVSFNVVYLIVVWGLVIAMIRRQPDIVNSEKSVTKLFIWAFTLLAIGDTGHVGFRVLAYSMSGLESTVSLFGRQVGLVGLGALSTAITVTLFYVLMLVIWHRRFQQPYGWFGGLLFLAAAVRLLLFLLPQNQWSNTVPPQPWSLVRNSPLVILGLGVAYLMLRDSTKVRDTTFQWIGIMILVSYAFYAPVIFFVQEVPAIGMLMIPKTLAYLVIGFIAYRDLFSVPEISPQI